MKIQPEDIAKHMVIKLTLENLGVPDIGKHVDWLAVSAMNVSGHPSAQEADVRAIVDIVNAAFERAKADG